MVAAALYRKSRGCSVEWETATVLSPPEAELPCCVLAGDGEESSTCKKQKGRETRRRSRSEVACQPLVFLVMLRYR